MIYIINANLYHFFFAKCVSWQWVSRNKNVRSEMSVHCKREKKDSFNNIYTTRGCNCCTCYFFVFRCFGDRHLIDSNNKN